MKKALLLLASTALLLVGCAKEKFAEPIDRGMTNVTFTASLDGGVATKADIDNDGKGTNVNRCIMEIYFGDALYKRMEAAMSGTPASATFSNVPVVAGKEYEILFWADHVDVVNTEAGLATDKYYTTKTTTDNKGLKAVTVKKADFIDALKNKKNDELDAFSFADKYTVPQGGKSYTAKLKRPFAQLNVITTDVAAGKTVTSADLLPETVTVSYTAATIFNVADSTATESATYEYTAPVYGDKTNWTAVKNRGELTLSMDYLLASTEQGAVDVTFITKNGGQAVMTHNLTNLPYKRNYRTNVKGDLLTVGGTWKAEIEPKWSEPDIVKVVEVADIKSANEIINQYASSTDNLEVKFVGVPNDSGIPSGDASSEFRAILTSPLKQDANLGIEVMTNTKTLYVGDYKVEYSIAELAETAQLKAATVNINVPQNSGIGTLIINAPSKTVLVNGKLVSNVGTITNIDAITSQNTLIIEPGQNVTKLTMRQGGLEIHGTVDTLVIAEEDRDNNPVKVRTSENLSQTVFDVIYKKENGEVAHDFIDRPDFVEKQNGDKWDIVPAAVFVGSVENPTASYATLEQAVANEANSALFLMQDVETASEIVVGEGKDITLNLNGHNINSGNHPAFQIFGGKLNIVGAGEIVGTPSLHKGIWLKGSTNAAATDYSVLTVGPLVSVKCVDGYAIMISNNNGSAYGAKIDIQGTVEGEYGALYVNGSIQKTTGNVPEITVRGKLSNPDDAAVYAAGYAKYVFEEGADVSGLSSMYICGGDIVINGGTFTGFGPAVEFVETSNEYGSTGEAIVVDSREGYVKPIKLCIKGGYFSSEHNRPVGSYPVGSEVKNFIQGGFFSAELPEIYVVEGCLVVENTDDATKAKYPWAVDRKHVAMIGSTKYHTLADAVAAAQIGNTIQMIDDFETADKVTVAADKEIVLDLNGKTISYTTDGYGAFITNCGYLTITDSSNGKNGKITACHSNPNWMEGCYTIDNSGQPSNYNKASTLIIEAGTIENTSPQGLAWPINNGSWGTKAELIINGGTIHSVNYVPVREYLHYGGKKTIVINGGKFISDNSRAIAVQVNDATIQDTGSSVTINGGEFTCNGSGILYIDLHAANANLTGFTMTVNDGKFLNNNANVPVLVYDDEGNTQTEAKLLSKILKGGIYSKEPAAELISFGYHIETNTDSQTSSAYPYRVVANSAEGAEVSVSKQGQATVYSTLAAFRDETNAGNTFAGYTVTLLKDIDLTNDDWTPIGTTDYYYYFSGVFDGNNHLVTLNKSEIPGDFGFFNLLVGDSEDTPAIVENLNLKVNLSSKQSTRTWIGGVTDMAYGYVLFENIVVTGSITSGGYAGGIVGYSSQNDSDWGSKVIYKNCTNKANINIVGKGDYTCLGGIAAQTGSNLDCFINCKNEGILTSDHTKISTAASYMGHMVGKGTYGKNISFSGCSFSESATINGWNVYNSEVSSYPFEGYMTPSQTYTYGTGTPNLGKQMVGGYFGTCTLDGVQQNFTYPNGNSDVE